MNEVKIFDKTLKELEAFLALPINSNRDRAGIIQAFEFTFEQSWKSIQKIAASHGIEIGSPKKAFSVALQNGWIAPVDEPKWLQMIKDRNLTSHTYEEALAKEILKRIQKDYVDLFRNLLDKLSIESQT